MPSPPPRAHLIIALVGMLCLGDWAPMIAAQQRPPVVDDAYENAQLRTLVHYPLFDDPRAMHLDENLELVLVADRLNRTVRAAWVFREQGETLVELPAVCIPTSVTAEHRIQKIYVGCENSEIYVAQRGSGTDRAPLQLSGSRDDRRSQLGTVYPHARFGEVTVLLRDRPGHWMFVADGGDGVIAGIDFLHGDSFLVAGNASLRGIHDGLAVSGARFGRITAMSVHHVARVLYVCDQPVDRATSGKFGSVVRRITIPKAGPSIHGRQGYVVTTVAGSATEDLVSSRDGPIAEARFFWNIGGVAADGANTALFISDENNAAIRAINFTTGNVSTVVGPPPPANITGFLDEWHTNARMESPIGGVFANKLGWFIFIDRNGRIPRSVLRFPPGPFVDLTTRTQTLTVSPAPTRTSTPTFTTPSPSLTPVPTRTATASSTESGGSRSKTPGATASPSGSLTLPPTATATFTATASPSGSTSTTASASVTETTTRTSTVSVSRTVSLSVPPTTSTTVSVTVSPGPTSTLTHPPTQSVSMSTTTSRSVSDGDESYTVPTRSFITPSEPNTETNTITDSYGSMTQPLTPSRTSSSTASLALPVIRERLFLLPSDAAVSFVSSVVALVTIFGGAMTSWSVLPGVTDVQLLILESQNECLRPSFGETFDNLVHIAHPFTAPGTSAVENIVAAALLPLGVAVIHAFIAEVLIRRFARKTTPDAGGQGAANLSAKARRRRERRAAKRREKLAPRTYAHARVFFPAITLFVLFYFLPSNVARSAHAVAVTGIAADGSAILGGLVTGLAFSGVAVLTLGRTGEGGIWLPFLFAFDSLRPRGFLRQRILPSGTWTTCRHRSRFGPVYYLASEGNAAWARGMLPLRALVAAFTLGCSYPPDDARCAIVRGCVGALFLATAVLVLIPRVLRSPPIAFTSCASSCMLATAALTTFSKESRAGHGRRGAFGAAVGVPCCAFIQLAVCACDELLWRKAERQAARVGWDSKAAAKARKRQPGNRKEMGGDADGSRSQSAHDDSSDRGGASRSDSPSPAGSGYGSDDALRRQRGRTHRSNDGGHDGAALLSVPQRQTGETLPVAVPWLAQTSDNPLPPGSRSSGQPRWSPTRTALNDPNLDLRAPPALGRDTEYWVPAHIEGAPRMPEFGLPLIDVLIDSDVGGTDKKNKTKKKKAEKKKAGKSKKDLQKRRYGGSL